MEHKEDFELVLNHISAEESMFKDEKRYENYAHTAMIWLNHQGKYLFADQIISQYNSLKTMEEVLGQYKFQYYPGHMVQRGKKREQVYYDVWGMDVIEGDDPFFPFFFACKFSHMDIFQLDDFLSYHLEHSFENNMDKFLRALELMFRRYDYLLNQKSIDTAKEWISAEQKKPGLSGTESQIIKKARVKRDAGDNITSLNNVQTAYLINLLKQSRVIIKDDTILTSKAAGEAFSLLTGYSPDTLRLKMNLKGQRELTYQDRTKVRQILYEIVTLIDKEINEQKGKKS